MRELSWWIRPRFSQPLVPQPGVLTRRAPRRGSRATWPTDAGSRGISPALDLGQTVVVRDRACVAVEAMEGTDETIERAARIAGRKALVVVKVSKPDQDMRFDVPVVGLPTIEVMKRFHATALAIDAGRTLLFDRAQLIAAADAAGIAIQAFAPATTRQRTGSRSGREGNSDRAEAFAWLSWALVILGGTTCACTASSTGVELVGVRGCRSRRARPRRCGIRHGCARPSVESSAGRVDAVSVAVPTAEHARLGCRC